MNAKKTRLTALILALAMLTSCAQSPVTAPPQQTAGRYVESEITPPDAGRFSSFLMADGTIVCYDEGLQTCYQSSDLGENWTLSPGPGSGSDDFQDVQSGTVLQDGSLIVYLREGGLVKIAPDGVSSPFSVSDLDRALAEGQTAMLSLIQSLPQNRLLIGFSAGNIAIQTGIAGEKRKGSASSSPSGQEQSTTAPDTTEQETAQSSATAFGQTMSKTLLIDSQTGEIIAELPVQNPSAAAADGEFIYVLGFDGAAQVFSLADGASANKTIDLSAGGASGGLVVTMVGALGGTLALGADGSLYTAQNGSLIRAGADIPAETVLEGTAYSIGTPRTSVSSVHVPEGAIIVNMLAGEQNKLYKYIWDENAAYDPAKTIQIWSLEDNSVVRAAIAEMRKSHPDAVINLEIALSAGAVSVSDAVKALNTRLLNGSGPDIIILDGTPAQSYAAKGMLLDLSALADTFDVYSTLATPYDSGTYYIPIQFSLPALIGSAERLERAQTLDGLTDLIVNGNDPALPSAEPGALLAGVDESERAELHFDSLSELCDLLWQASAGAIIADNTLNTDALRKYLECAKAISDKYSLTAPASSGSSLMASVFDGGAATTVPSSLIRYSSRTTNMGAFSLISLALLQITASGAPGELAPFPGLSPGAWQPMTIAAISADSAVPELACEMLGIMLSPAIQGLNYGMGLPVTKTGMQAQIDAIESQRSAGAGFAFDLEPLIASLQTPVFSDSILGEMTWSTVEKCCKGEISIDEAVSEIERNIKNYLAERA